MKINEIKKVGKDKVLTICLLTYNRENHLRNVLEFLKEEYNSLENKSSVEIIISDNHSTDGTESFIKNFIKDNQLGDWLYNRNTENIGSIRNLLKGESLASGKYFWWWGDDDRYKPGILSTVLKHIASNPDYILLNHSASKEPWDCRYFSSAFDNIKKTNLRILDIIKSSPGCIMFISSSIYRMEKLKNLHKINYKINMALPLLYGIYCANSNNYILDWRVWVDDNYKDVSWGNEAFKVFNYYMPYYISMMPDLGYDKLESSIIYKHLYKGLRKKRIKYKLVTNIKKILEQLNCLDFAKKAKTVIIKK